MMVIMMVLRGDADADADAADAADDDDDDDDDERSTRIRIFVRGGLRLTGNYITSLHFHHPHSKLVPFHHALQYMLQV